jgi:arsenate reductase (thioredoxin)
MAEEGITIQHRAGQPVTRALTEGATRIVTFGCDIDAAGVDAPLVDEWRLIEATGKPIEDPRAQRDEIRRRVELLIDDLEEGEGHAD